MSVVTIERKVLEKNDALAAQNRAVFREQRPVRLQSRQLAGIGQDQPARQTIAELRAGCGSG